MCDPISTLTAGFSLFQGVKSLFGGSPADKASEAASRNADAQLKATQNSEQRAMEDLNRRNAKRADASLAGSAAGTPGNDGMDTTMLTGAKGVDPATLQLGKKTLLGY